MPVAFADFMMQSRHHSDALAVSDIPAMLDDMRNVLPADPDVAKLMVAQFGQQRAIGVGAPGAPRSAHQCLREGKQEAANPSSRRLALTPHLTAAKPARNHL
jgi:hypothetical protein